MRGKSRRRMSFTHTGRSTSAHFASSHKKTGEIREGNEITWKKIMSVVSLRRIRKCEVMSKRRSWVQCRKKRIGREGTAAGKVIHGADCKLENGIEKKSHAKNRNPGPLKSPMIPRRATRIIERTRNVNVDEEKERGARKRSCNTASAETSGRVVISR